MHWDIATNNSSLWDTSLEPPKPRSLSCIADQATLFFIFPIYMSTQVFLQTQCNLTWSRCHWEKSVATIGRKISRHRLPDIPLTLGMNRIGSRAWIVPDKSLSIQLSIITGEKVTKSTESLEVSKCGYWYVLQTTILFHHHHHRHQ